MPRYIFLSFVFLAWAFYELSGGADFEPDLRVETAEAEVTAPKTTPPTAIERVRMARATQAAELVATDAIAEETLPALTPVAEPTAISEREVATAVAEPAVQRPRRARGPDLSTGLSQFADDEATEIRVAAVETPTPAPAPEAIPVRAPVSEAADMRKVVATRVNMRAGPGTDHDILDRLRRGQDVEVLGDNGLGWLRIRTLPEDRVGWIAQRLVSAPG